MNGRGFRLSPIFFIKVQPASESWIFRENKKIESGGQGYGRLRSLSIP